MADVDQALDNESEVFLHLFIEAVDGVLVEGLATWKLRPGRRNPTSVLSGRRNTTII
jgi:hypothetical protein